MALKKEIISNNGAIANYHRICSVRKNSNQLIIELDSYATEQYRNKERQFFEISDNLQEINNRYADLTSISLEEQTQEILDEITFIEEKFNFYQKGTEKGDFYLFCTTVIIDCQDDDISFSGIYNELKQNNEVFKDAEDC